MSIKNIVATAHLMTNLNLEDIMAALPGYSSINKAFNSLNIKTDKNTLLQLFKHGKVIVIGGQTEGQSKRLFLRYLRLLAEIGVPTEYENFRIQNIVACYDHGSRVNLARIAAQYKLEFEPELFPAVRLRNNHFKVTTNIFHTGKCVILGARSVELVNHTVCYIRKIFKNAETGFGS